jgi:hypothetical protein
VALSGLFIVAYSMALRDPAGSDDVQYFQSVAGKTAGAAHHHQRYVLLGSIWLAQAVFGYTLTGYYAVTFCSGLGLIVASYLLARSFVGPLFAFVAGLMVNALPDLLENSSLLMPDVTGQFWLVLGLFAFLRFFTAELRSRLWAALSAFSFFAAASAKESLALALLGLICLPLAFVRSREKWVRFVTVAGGVAVLEGIQTVILWAVHGDPLYRLHSVSSGHLPQMEYYARTPSKMPQDIDLAHLATRFLDGANAEPAYGAGALLGYWHLLLGSLAVALGVAIWKRDRLLLGFGGFVLAAYATLTFPIISLDPIIPVVRTIGRYFIVVLTFLPVFIVAGWSLLLRDLSARVTTKRGRYACAALLVVVCLSYTSTAATSAAHYLKHDPRLLDNGGGRLARTGESVLRYVRKHPEVKRVLGPKLIRAGDFSWGLDVDVRGMPTGHLKHFTKQRDDLLLDDHPARVMKRSNLIWRRVGHADIDQMVHIAVVGDRHSAGEWEMLALTDEEVPRSSHAKVSVHLKVRVKSARLEPLELVTYGKRVRTVQRKSWTRKGDTYTVDLESKPFPTRRVNVCTLRIGARGRGTFEILERKVSASSAKPDSARIRPSRSR